MAGVRMTGLVSGLDTESLVAQLSEAYKKKVDNVKKEQTKLEWKKEAWSSLNTKLMDFYKGALSTFKSVSTYRTKMTTGDLKGVKVTAGSNAVNGSHRVKVISTATAQMWTGKKINDNAYTSTSYKAAPTGDIKLSDLKDSIGNSIGSQLANAKFTVTKDGLDYEVDLTGIGEDATVDDVVTNINQQLSGSGVKVDFAAGTFRMSNETAIATNTQNEVGETTTVFTGGSDVTVTTADESTANIFGLKADGETVIESRSSESKDPVTTIGGYTKVYQEVQTEGSKVTGSSKLIDLGIKEGTNIEVNGHTITVDRKTTLSSLASSMAKLGIEANYDEKQGRFYLNSKATGSDNAFEVKADDATLAALGLDLKRDADGNITDDNEGYIKAENAVIEYNGVRYEQASSTFEINGLTIEAVEKGDSQTFSVGTDAQGIYDKVKEFVKAYNTLIDEMNTLYSAARVKDYEPLTEDEKKGMSDDEIEKWEGVIKASLLRRDDTISSLLSSMRSTLNKSVEVVGADGTTKKYALTSFGINTSTYTERGKLHIYGDKDDSDFADFEDSLMKAINSNPQAVEKTLSTLGSEIYNNLMKAMSGDREMSSALTFYNDKQMDKEIKQYKDRVSTLEEKMLAEEDKYYKQFSAMESAMAKLQSQQSYLSQLFGM